MNTASELEQRTTAHYFLDDKKWVSFKCNYLTREDLIKICTRSAFNHIDPYWQAIDYDEMELGKGTKIFKMKFYNEFEEKILQILFVGRVRETHSKIPSQ